MSFFLFYYIYILLYYCYLEYSFTQYYKKGSRKFETYLEPLTSLFFFFFLRTYPYLEGSFTIILSIYLLTKSEESIIRLPKCGTNRGMWKISPRECGISTHYYKKRGPPLIYIRMSLKSFYLNIIK